MVQLRSTFSVSEAVLNEIPAIVEVHQQAFPGFLMTLLGPAFLYAYYKTVLDHPGSIFLVVRDEEGGIRGFVAGFAQPESFYRLLGGRKKRMMLSAASYLVMRPRLWKRVFENMKMVNQRSNVDSSRDMDVELASIGVNPNSGRRGYGKILVQSFIEKAKAKSAASVFLTTDARDNSTVNEFYLNLGFNLSGCSERAGGRLMNHYEYRFK
ncbi:GNAT family N-acetyltransferase [Terasakiella sp.]|uniref:GNAT family N-acetyltransferase n=1 Tax=Terasakiella sp. TaxID=2034861 RepID=UPI003AA92A1E